MRLKPALRGTATVEMALTLVAAIVPITIGFIAFTEIAWTYHALITLTRDGARYAATHACSDDGGSVVRWMQANAPAFPDRAQLSNGGISIQVSYWNHVLTDNQGDRSDALCDGGCAVCAPDSVTVSISGYQFNHFLTMLGLQPLQVPPFSTTVPIESAGGDADPPPPN
jgi:hypothetical protein